MKTIGKAEILYPAIMATLILFAAFVTYKIWNLGKYEDDYTTICLGGHQYWHASFGAKGFLGIKLDDNGNPVLCDD